MSEATTYDRRNFISGLAKARSERKFLTFWNCTNSNFSSANWRFGSAP